MESRSEQPVSPLGLRMVCLAATVRDPDCVRRPRCAWTCKRVGIGWRLGRRGGVGSRGIPHAGEVHRRALPHRVRDLRNCVHVGTQLFQLLAWRVPCYLNLIADVLGNCRLSDEIAAYNYSNSLQMDAAGTRLPEQIIGDAPSDSEVQELTSVEAESSPATASRTVDDQRVRASAADGRCLGANISELNLEGHRAIISEGNRTSQPPGPALRPRTSWESALSTAVGACSGWRRSHAADGSDATAFHGGCQEAGPEVGAAIGRRDNRGSRRRKWGISPGTGFQIGRFSGTSSHRPWKGDYSIRLSDGHHARGERDGSTAAGQAASQTEGGSAG